MPTLKPGTLLPASEEDARITAAAEADPDAHPLSEEEWQIAKPIARVDRPKTILTKGKQV